MPSPCPSDLSSSCGGALMSAHTSRTWAASSLSSARFNSRECCACYFPVLLHLPHSQGNGWAAERSAPRSVSISRGPQSGAHENA
eukprot:7179438-Pyramimonas_sp.AAC.1